MWKTMFYAAVMQAVYFSKNAYSTQSNEKYNLPSNDCHVALGVANRGLFPAFWMLSSDGVAWYGRLHQSLAWTSTKLLYPQVKADERRPTEYAWLQVDLRHETLVTGIQTQGDPVMSNWVTVFSVMTSRDCETFSPVTDASGNVTKFYGNYDGDTVVTTLLGDVLRTRCVRLIPLEMEGWQAALRMELLGCDDDLCRESVISHLRQESVPLSYQLDDSKESSYNAEMVTGAPARVEPENTEPWTLPTIITRGFAEFKFPAEQIVLGVVLERLSRSAKADKAQYIVTYSRNCHSWLPIRQRKNVGETQVFDGATGREHKMYTFSYIIRAQCIRIIPIGRRYISLRKPIRAHFLGCGITHRCGERKRVRHKRVVGGNPTDVASWPWLASLQVRSKLSDSWRHLCGGSLIHPEWVLTAAHCIATSHIIFSGKKINSLSMWNEPSFLKSMKFRLGKQSLSNEEDTQVERGIRQIYIHHNYNMSFYISDVALLRLDSEVRLTDHINVVCLAEANQFPVDTNCVLVGWGHTDSGYPERPHVGDVPLVDRSSCDAMYAHLTITQDMMCAGHPNGTTDACMGDSGSPLVCENADRQWFQVGISSWNIGCGKPGYPSVYVNVSHFVYWLDSIMSGFAVTAENVSQDGIPNTADYSDVTAVTRIEDFTNEYYTAVSDVTGRTNNILSTKVPVSNLEKAENPHTTDPGLSDTTSGDEW